MRQLRHWVGVFVAICLVGGLGVAAMAQSAEPTPGALLIADFESDLGDRLSSYAGPQSTIKAEVVNEGIQGQRALRIESSLKDWNGVVIQPAKDQPYDWSKYAAISFWMRGSNSGETFFVELNDKGEEHFRSPLITDDFTGWKHIIVPIEEFSSRQDWQPENADIDLDISWPLKDFQIFTSVGGAGTILIDLIEIIP